MRLANEVKSMLFNSWPLPFKSEMTNCLLASDGSSSCFRTERCCKKPSGESSAISASASMLSIAASLLATASARWITEPVCENLIVEACVFSETVALMIFVACVIAVSSFARSLVRWSQVFAFSEQIVLSSSRYSISSKRVAATVVSSWLAVPISEMVASLSSCAFSMAWVLAFTRSISFWISKSYSLTRSTSVASTSALVFRKSSKSFSRV
mmetsp:Transcript_87316/g.137845  ORF Transcript_87316/g.137845 Transcript_87316/m.137845 type:complete len:212 (-) Transcript_87316:771-1406(-)